MFVKIIYLPSHYPIEMMSLPECFHDFKVILQEESYGNKVVTKM